MQFLESFFQFSPDKRIMPPMETMDIPPNLSIPLDELRFSYSRSAGPGGQNVNKLSTRVTLAFDVETSPSLTDTQRALIRERLGNRLTREGVLQLHCDVHRTQSRNREEAMDRFVRLLTMALRPRIPRRPTSIPWAAKRQRMEDKRLRGTVKRLRRSPLRIHED
jgi:ribosome-associated protein